MNLLNATENKPTFQLGYRKYLDGVRGIAVLLVLIFHSNTGWLRGGFIGVDVFFVLSGFLITSLLLQEWQASADISLRKFYLRRVLRLLPALVCFLLISGAVSWAEKPETYSHTLQAIGASLFYFMNWALAFGWMEVTDVTAFSHTWSLSSEEQFYLFFPILLIALLKSRLPHRWIVLLFSVLLSVPTVLRLLLWQDEVTSKRLYFAFDTRADGLLLGCLIAMLACWNLFPQRKAFRRLIIITNVPAAIYLLYVALGFPFGKHYPTTARFLYTGGGFTLINLSIGVLLMSLIEVRPQAVIQGLEWNRLVWVGRISYALYLWHVPVFLGLFSISFLNGLFSLLFYDLPVYQFAVTFALASASYYFIEKPFLNMKKRFQAGKGGELQRQSVTAEAVVA